MMNAVIKEAIEFAHEWNDGFEVTEVSRPIPIWDDLTEGQKTEALEYVFKNEHDEDFGHSGCCKAIHQATAYYCVILLTQEVDEECHFDDLDFMMAKDVRNNPQIQSMFGISEDF